MTLGELKEAVEFEAGAKDINSLGGWVEITAREILDSYTAQVKYPELYLPDLYVTLSSGVAEVDLPDYVQRIDFDTVTYAPGGSLTDSYPLIRKSQKKINLNEGKTKYFYHTLSYTGVQRLVIYPFDEINIGDSLRMNIWTKATTWQNGDASIIFPEQLAETVKREVLMRASLTLGNIKNLSAQKMFRDEAFSRSFGITDVND